MHPALLLLLPLQRISHRLPGLQVSSLGVKYFPQSHRKLPQYNQMSHLKSFLQHLSWYRLEDRLFLELS